MSEPLGPRADALRMLATWTHADAAQMALREEFADFLDANRDGVLRQCRPAHLTASAIVFDDAAERVLLTLHPKVGRWLQLGGHVEPGDGSVRDAALREAREESGIEALQISPTPVRLDRHPVRCGPDGESLHLDAQFWARAGAGSRHRRSSESDDLRWFPIEEVAGVADPSVHALVTDALARLNAR